MNSTQYDGPWNELTTNNLTGWASWHIEIFQCCINIRKGTALVAITIRMGYISITISIRYIIIIILLIYIAITIRMNHIS